MLNIKKKIAAQLKVEELRNKSREARLSIF